MKHISSSQNPYIKSLVQLQDKAKNRKNSQSFLIEGQREIMLALKGNFKLKTLLYCEELISLQTINQIGARESDTEFIKIDKEVYQKLAYRDTTEGVLAVAESKSNRLEDLKLSKNPLILVAEAPEKPGNIGALLRTADAANIDAVIIVNPKTDIYNPNVIRSSVGCIFTIPVATATTSEAIAFLNSKNVAIYAAILQEAAPYYLQDYNNATAIVVGTEATGLTDEWRIASAQNIIIPMEGVIDSMNVSVAASILLFEAKRQRFLKNSFF